MGIPDEAVVATVGDRGAYADKDLAKGKNGAAFIAVHCPTEKIKTHA
jgi:hypothetical protein